MSRKRRGQRSPSPRPFPRGRSSGPALEPFTRQGHGAQEHHPRPKNGTATIIKAAHQAIHTKHRRRIAAADRGAEQPGNHHQHQPGHGPKLERQLRPSGDEDRPDDGEAVRSTGQLEPALSGYAARSRSPQVRRPGRQSNGSGQHAAPDHERMQRPAWHRTADAKRSGPVGDEAHARRLAGVGGHVDVIAFDVQPVSTSVSRIPARSSPGRPRLTSITAGVNAKRAP